MLRKESCVPDIHFEINPAMTSDEFASVLDRSTLADRRPVGDALCMEGMVRHANLTITARHGGKLIGVARSVTDFFYCCYLSDLAVDQNYQQRGIGRELIRLTKTQLGDKCRIILLSAPQAVDYYPKLGFVKHPQAWVLEPEKGVQ
jgi:predicted N-acetyltransferase YhbS